MTGRIRSSFARLRRRDADGEPDESGGLLWAHSYGESRGAPAPRPGPVRGATDRDLEIVHALGRVADTFARIADGLDADRRERRAQFEADRTDRRTQLDAVEYLLREMAIGVGGATAVPPVVVGGSIEPDAIGAGTDGDVEINLTGTTETTDMLIEIDAEVEVRSRFHDGWVHGFTVADYVRGRHGFGYRLRRLAEAEPLPMLYEPADVRRAIMPTEPPPPPPLPRSSISEG
jgi:hypothetical protein